MTFMSCQGLHWNYHEKNDKKNTTLLITLSLLHTQNRQPTSNVIVRRGSSLMRYIYVIVRIFFDKTKGQQKFVKTQSFGV